MQLTIPFHGGLSEIKKKCSET